MKHDDLGNLMRNNVGPSREEIERDVAVLMADGCLRSEAIKHLECGSTVYEREDLLQNIDTYLADMSECFADESEAEGFREKLRAFFLAPQKNRIPDWGFTVLDGKEYIIEYVL